MSVSVLLARKIDTIAPELKDVLWTMLEEIERNREEAVTKVEFNELKEIVRDLGLAQQRTEKRVEELAEAQKELAEAQNRTEQRVEELAGAQKELAEAQKRTEQKIEELIEAQKRTEEEIAKLSRGLNNTRSQVGGLARSVAYALENEAYRKLPTYLNTRHDLRLEERFIRQELGGEEMNIFAKAVRNGGEEVMLVGETVLRLDDISKFAQLEKNVKIVKEHYQLPVVPILVTHFARPNLLEYARNEGIIVVQSFDWD
ncbi:hypothetical protein U27_04621 [Candidatus Vecturithrix granuli]|uniref:Chordopoxvirus fusion protein n=1 Tax=Vecturithrix granuli TaxID=1499967 RepID=A0A081BZ99_VECG1|nr:hypothetical protein U27_04621 [Candidatus Vecturithrix granuli]